MNKISKILITSLLAIGFSIVSAYGYNKESKKNEKTSLLSKNSTNFNNNGESTNFNLCSMCAGCNGNCIIKK